MEYVAENRYVCEEHGFDKTALVKGTTRKAVVDRNKALKLIHLQELKEEFDCTDPMVTTKISELVGTK